MRDIPVSVLLCATWGASLVTQASLLLTLGSALWMITELVSSKATREALQKETSAQILATVDILEATRQSYWSYVDTSDIS